MNICHVYYKESLMLEVIKSGTKTESTYFVLN